MQGFHELFDSRDLNKLLEEFTGNYTCSKCSKKLTKKHSRIIRIRACEDGDKHWYATRCWKCRGPRRNLDDYDWSVWLWRHSG